MKTIEHLIPRRNIVVYLHIFHKLRELNLRRLDKIDWIKPVFDIRENLQILVNIGYLEESDIEEIWKHVFTCLSKRGPDVAISALPRMLGLKHKGPTPRDEALDFLIFALWQDCLIYAKRPCFADIAAFLTEREIYSNTESNEPFTGEALRKRAIRLNEVDISDLVLFSSCICSHDDPLIPLDMAAGYDRRGFLSTLPHDPFLRPPKNNPLATQNRTQKRK